MCVSSPDKSGEFDGGVNVSVSPGPLGLLLCRCITHHAVVLGFEPLPSGVTGELEQSCLITPGMIIAGSVSRVLQY